MLKTIGDLGAIVAGLGLVAFAVVFLVSVRWWSDTLGRSIAAAASVPALIMGITAYRLLGGYLPGGADIWRAALFPVLGVVIWVSLGIFIKYHFFARRARNEPKERINA